MPLADGPLRRLIETSPLPVHLVTDTDHRSLAASPAREHEWGQTAAGLLGQTLWRFAARRHPGSRAIAGPARLVGGHLPQPVELWTGARNAGLRIRCQMMTWERVYLADGTPARLCLTSAFSSAA